MLWFETKECQDNVRNMLQEAFLTKNAFMLINQLTKELAETNKKLKPILVERQFKKNHKERKELGVYDKTN